MYIYIRDSSVRESDAKNFVKRIADIFANQKWNGPITIADIHSTGTNNARARKASFIIVDNAWDTLSDESKARYLDAFLEQAAVFKAKGENASVGAAFDEFSGKYPNLQIVADRTKIQAIVNELRQLKF